MVRCSIPNKEVSQEYIDAISTMIGSRVANSVEDSRKLLKELWSLNATTAAPALKRLMKKKFRILQYNDENSLSCTIQLAFLFCKRSVPPLSVNYLLEKALLIYV